MEWNYKNIKITIDAEGMFYFNYLDIDYKYTSLQEAKNSIDSLSERYYTFTQKDMNILMRKLGTRERDLVRSLYQEIEKHRRNAYCEIGIAEDCWKWKWDFNK